jgi:septal ring factor EnvC (AmiA/AmiB activator)
MAQMLAPFQKPVQHVIIHAVRKPGSATVSFSLILSPEKQRTTRPRPFPLILQAFLTAGLVACLIVGGSKAMAQTSERAKQKQAAEAERAALRQKLSTLKREIQQTETARESAADALAESEAAISDANRTLRELAQEQREISKALADLSASRRELQQQIDGQQQQLNDLLREQYMTDSEDRTKLLLSGDNPNRINRELRYMSYISKAQSELLENLRTNLNAVEKNRLKTEKLKQEMDAVAQEERAQKAELEKQKAKRADLLAQLSTKLAVQRKEAGSIERDEQRLGNLLNRLSKLIEQQRRAEAERRAREKTAREKAAREQERQHAVQDESKRTPSSFRQNDQAKSGPYNALTPESGSNAKASAFRTLRGKLRLPVRGELVAKYGSRRDEGPSWKGLFIRTEEGSEVKAVADGEVIFADWLRGFGNLVIIDHGDQYLTIYGNNQSLFKHAGDAVKTGEVIANTGSSGGIEQPGLYFEMRHDGRPFDPLKWVTIR